MQGRHLLIRSQDCLSNGQTKQNMEVQHHQLCKQVQVLQVFCHLHPPLVYGCETWTLLADSSKINLLVGPQEPLLASVKRHGMGMSHTMTAGPKPSFRAPCTVGDVVVSRRIAGWTTSKSGHPCPCQNC